MSHLDEINQLGCWEWNLRSFDGWKLCLEGGTDLLYSHVIEIWISGVAYISCPTRAIHARFRDATDLERDTLARLVDLTSNPYILTVEADTTASLERLPFFIVGDTIEVILGTVYHYDRPDLKSGERLAPWVRKTT